MPSKTNELWPLPVSSKLVVANDLLSERNISNPVKIIVRSFSRDIPVNRDLSPLFSPVIKIIDGGKVLATLANLPQTLQKETYNAIFYGRGRGIHSTTPFTGALLSEVLKPYAMFTSGELKSTLVLVVGIDGYRCIYSLSEIMNRSDHEEILLVEGKDGENGGRYRVFPSCDFFSDRAIKAVSEISLVKAE